MESRSSQRIAVPVLDTYKPHKGSLYQFCAGIRFCWAGLGILLRSPRLQLTSLIPILMTAGGFAGIIWFGVRLVRQLLDSLLASVANGVPTGLTDWMPEQLTSWVPSGVAQGLAHWVSTATELLGSAVVAIALVVVSYIVFVPVVGIVAGPFREAIARQTERLVRGTVTEQGLSLGAALVELFKLVGFQLLVLTTLIVLSLAAPALGALPTLVLGVSLTALDMTDPALGLRGYRLGQKLRFVARHRCLMAGFGLMSFFLFTIPGINLLILPVATIGGALMVVAVADSDRPSI
jgi:CysZ protein